ncbi:MAG: glycoside hydrolase family 88 protein [Acidimicrobiales bacterium]
MTSTEHQNVLRSAAERTLRFRFGTWYWGDAIAVDGLLAADQVVGGPFRDAVVDCLDRWTRLAPTTFDDALVPGRAVLQLVADGALPPAAAERVVAGIERLPLLGGAIPALEPHRPQFRFGVCIDALYHLPAMMVMAGEYRGDPGAGRAAIRIATEILELLRCRTGWAQWYDFSLRRNNAVSWSRGLGWAVLGLLDLLELVEGAEAGYLVEATGRILESLAAEQAPSGNWPAVLGNSRAAEETSTAAFFLAAALHPKTSVVGTPSRARIQAATAAVFRAVTADGTYGGVSADVLPSWDESSYERFPVEPSPWGQGAALRALVALAAAAEKIAGVPDQLPG